MGYPELCCISYEELCADPSCLTGLELDYLRIDSPGENERVAQRLIALGGGPKNCELEFGQIGYLREYHRGFCSVLDHIQASGIRCQNAPDEIALMFDKWACHLRFEAAGLARPQTSLAPPEMDLFRIWMKQRAQGRIFLKPLHGSSASGVCALQWQAQRCQLTAPIRIERTRSNAEPARLLNSLKVQRYVDWDDIQLILEQLLPQGMIIEQWIPKLTLPGGAVDLRVLVVASEARHRVVRQSRHPMTNLHLGNQRGSEDELLDKIGLEKFQAALSLAERATNCFPGSLAAGVDILIDHSGRSWIGEINAFGDLLPRLVHREQSAYQAIAESIAQARVTQ